MIFNLISVKAVFLKEESLEDQETQETQDIEGKNLTKVRRIAPPLVKVGLVASLRISPLVKKDRVKKANHLPLSEAK